MEKRKLIVLPGNICSPFFVNEIPYLKKYFEDIYVLSFSSEKEGKEILDKYELNGEFREKLRVNIHYLTELFCWLQEDYVKHEVKNVVSLSKQGVRKLVYIFLYGYYYIMSKDLITEQINNSQGEVYIYSYWLSRAGFCIANIDRKQYPNIKRIFSRAHGYDIYFERNSSGYLPFRQYIEDRLDRIYFISEDGMEYFTSRVSVHNNSKYKAKKKVARLGTYNNNKLVKTIIDKQEIVIASCSSIIQLKRLDLIIDVIQYASEKGINVKWIHIGSGELEKEIKKQANMKLEKKQAIFLGNVDNKKVLETYIKYDVDFFINMSDTEGIPVSVMEALSGGIPVIARNVGGLQEIISEDCGLLINDPTVNEYDKIIDFLLIREKDKEKYQSKSNAAYYKWDTEYNAEKNYTQFMEDIL